MERKTKSTPEIITIDSDTDNDLDIIVISSDSEDDVKEMKQQSEKKKERSESRGKNSFWTLCDRFVVSCNTVLYEHAGREKVK